MKSFQRKARIKISMGGVFKLAILFAVLVFASCKNDFEMEKPSEKAVSDLTANVSYYSNYNGSGWQVYLYWFYDSADPAEYLVVCREDGSDEVHKIKSGSLSAFNSHSLTDTWSNPGKYTYTVYTVGNGYSTSASKSVTVNCEYPSYNGGSSSGSGSSGSGSLSSTSWSTSDNSITLRFSGNKVDYITNNTQTFYYSYISGSGTFYADETKYVQMGTFDVKGDELYWYLSSGYSATFYKQ